MGKGKALRLAVLFGLLALALWLVLQLDGLTVAWSVGGALLTATYPFMKRFFPLPQLYLGAAFGFASFSAFTGNPEIDDLSHFRVP